MPELEVRFIGEAVGCTIVTLEDKTLLIDTGNSTVAAVNCLRDMGIGTIDYFVITHFHSENICGAENVLSAFDVGTVIMPEMADSDMSIATRKQVNRIKQAEADFVFANKTNAGQSFMLGSAKFTLLTPLVVKYADEYDCYSIALRLEYGQTSFIFMSDVTPENTAKLIENNTNLKADVIKVSNYGRAEYTSDALLDAVSPEYAVITLPNEWFDEHEALVEKLELRNVRTVSVRTGATAVFTSDGKTMKYAE